MSYSPGIHHGVDADDYHAGLIDPKPLSSSFAKDLITKSPLEAKWAQENRVDSDAFAIGRAIHELALEGEQRTFQVFELDSKRGKVWADAKTEAAANGRIAALPSDLALVESVAAAVRSHEVAAQLLEKGDPEVSALVESDGIYEQARADWLRTDGKQPVILDLKTTAGSANPRDFNRTIATYAYHLQAAMYVDVFERALGARPVFIWIVASKAAPHTVSVVKASESTLDTGWAIYNKAREIYAECTRTGVWPGYEGTADSLLPMWAEYAADEITGRTEVEILL